MLNLVLQLFHGDDIYLSDETCTKPPSLEQKVEPVLHGNFGAGARPKWKSILDPHC